MKKKKSFPIDLSMLTPEEVQQFAEDDSTLHDGDIDVSLYLRFSSERQTEQSIEGQLRDILAFCKRTRRRIVAIYVDRALSARANTEKRIRFQEMIQDSDGRNWQEVVVWKLDRFARNRRDSAIYKARLSRNGVHVQSAMETISKDPEGIILESVLEGMAEYFSADLSQKITRGMRESAMKGQNVGGHTPIGYCLIDKKLAPNPATAPIVLEAFTRYANGESITDISNSFNDRGFLTAKKVEFNKNSFHSMFRNERYIGVYTYKDIRKEGAIPAIVPKEIWDKVQDRLKQNGLAPARGKALVNYSLVGKLFCGHCGSMMVGDSGTGKMGKKYNYYTCAGRKRRRDCDKRPMVKDWLETVVAEDALALLTDELIEELADIAITQSETEIQHNTIIPALQKELKDADDAVSNIIGMIEKGIASTALAKRLSELEKTQKDLSRRLEKERKNVVILEKPQIIYWLTKFSKGDIRDEDFRRQIIDLLVNSVTVWDEPDGEYTITSTYNLTSGKTKTVKLKMPPNPGTPSIHGGSDLTSFAPPLCTNPNTMPPLW